MQAHFPPFTKPADAYDSGRLYRETSEIAAAQDAKRAMTPVERDAKLRTAAHHVYQAKRLMDEVFAEPKAHSRELLAECAREAQVMGLYADACIPEKTPSNSGLDAAATGKPPLEPSRIATPAELAYLASFGPNNNARSGHPMAAESLRLADERSPEDLL